MYKQMKIELLEELRRIIDDSYTISTFQAFKNGKERDAFAIIEPGAKASPTFYFENFLKDYKAGVPVHVLADGIVNIYYYATTSKTVDIDNFKNFDTQKDHIVYKLVNKLAYKSQLDRIPYIDFHDLILVFYALLDVDEEESTTYMVTNDMLKLWGIDKDTLFSYAEKNSPELLPVSVFSMTQLFMGEADDDLTLEEMIEELPDEPMYVLTNKYRTHGFSSILYPNVLKEISKKIGNFYILPASLHEAILVPAITFASVSTLKEHVRSVNATEVHPDDILGDSIYFYNSIKNKVEFLL